MKPLLHYTLNTGHTRKSPRKEVRDEVIRALEPLVSQGGPVPGPHGLDLTVTRADGGALFTIWKGLPIVDCAVAWTQKAQEELWPGLAAAYEDQWGGCPTMKPAHRPPRLPWLGVHLLPPSARVANDVLSMLGDLERCVAWALFEAENCPRKRRRLAKLLKQTGEVIPIEPANGRTFTPAELRAFVGGPIQIITPPGRLGAIMVVNENGKLGQGALRNDLASDIWQQSAHPESLRARDDVAGDVVLCHTSQVL